MKDNMHTNPGREFNPLPLVRFLNHRESEKEQWTEQPSEHARTTVGLRTECTVVNLPKETVLWIFKVVPGRHSKKKSWNIYKKLNIPLVSSTTRSQSTSKLQPERNPTESFTNRACGPSV